MTSPKDRTELLIQEAQALLQRVTETGERGRQLVEQARALEPQMRAVDQAMTPAVRVKLIEQVEAFRSAFQSAAPARQASPSARPRRPRQRVNV